TVQLFRRRRHPREAQPDLAERLRCRPRRTALQRQRAGHRPTEPIDRMSPPGNTKRRDFLFLQSTTEMGGAESSLLNLFTSSAELRARSLIVSLGFGKGDLPARLRATGAEVVELERARIRQ